MQWRSCFNGTHSTRVTNHTSFLQRRGVLQAFFRQCSTLTFSLTCPQETMSWTSCQVDKVLNLVSLQLPMRWLSTCFWWSNGLKEMWKTVTLFSTAWNSHWCALLSLLGVLCTHSTYWVSTQKNYFLEWGCCMSHTGWLKPLKSWHGMTINWILASQGPESTKFYVCRTISWSIVLGWLNVDAL